jgi:cysteine desulfurase/selenocysteine lyase
MANEATFLYEKARQIVADFIGTTPKNIVFTSGATAALNLVVNGLEKSLTSRDEILVFVGEHHADFVPWQQVCLRTGAQFKVIGLNADGTVNLDDFQEKLSNKTKIVALTHMSNVLGIENPIRKIADIVHNVGAKLLVDGSQSIAHIPVNVVDLDCDYFVFSGHKLYGPTGIGVLYGKSEALDILEPTIFGGDMVKEVGLTSTTFAEVPARLEAGTTPFVQAHGLAKAIEYVSTIGMKKIAEYEQKLTHKLLDYLKAIPNIQILGSGQYNNGLISFNVTGIHPNDLAFVLAKQNICVRVGHHCAMPIHSCLKVPVSLRVSFGLYNDENDVEAFVQALKKALSFF